MNESNPTNNMLQYLKVSEIIFNSTLGANKMG